MGIHADQNLVRLYVLTLRDENLFYDAGVRWLDDLDIRLRNQAALGGRDDVESSDGCPDDKNDDEGGSYVHNKARQARGWTFLDRKQPWREVQRGGR